MGTAIDAVQGIEDHIAQLRKRARVLQDELVEIDRVIDAGVVFLQSLSAAVGISTSNGILPEDLKDCDSLHAAMKRYAAMNGGVLSVMEAVPIFHQAGLSVSRNLRPTLHKLIARNRHEWEWVAAGRYAHKGEGAPATPGHGRHEQLE